MAAQINRQTRHASPLAQELRNNAVLAYRVSAERSGEPIYEALCTSTYLKDDDNWVRLSHQQTPAT